MPSFSSVFTPKFSGPVRDVGVSIEEDAVTALLQVMTQEMTEEVLARAALKAAEVFVPVAQSYAPVKTGWLKDHIKAEQDPVTEDMVGSASFGVSIEEVPYCWHQEYGTMNHPAHSYIRPAADNQSAQSAAVQEAGEFLQRVLARVAELTQAASKRGVA